MRRSDLDAVDFDFSVFDAEEVDRLASEKAERMVMALLPEVLRFVAAGRTGKSRMTRLWGAMLYFRKTKASEAAEEAGVSRQAVEQSAALCEEEMARLRRRLAA